MEEWLAIHQSLRFNDSLFCLTIFDPELNRSFVSSDLAHSEHFLILTYATLNQSALDGFADLLAAQPNVTEEDIEEWAPLLSPCALPVEELDPRLTAFLDAFWVVLFALMVAAAVVGNVIVIWIVIGECMH